MAKKRKPGRPKAKSNLPAKRRSSPRAAAPKRRSRRSGLSEGPLSGGNFSVLTKALAEAGFGAVVANMANSLVKNQSPAIRGAVNVLVPIGISKLTRKPMMAAGAAGVCTINIVKIIAPQSKFLNDWEPESAMNDLNGLEDGHPFKVYNYASVPRINRSRFSA